MFKRVCKWMVDKSKEVVKVVENKVENFRNKSPENLDDLGNLILIIGIPLCLSLGFSIKAYANTKKG